MADVRPVPGGRFIHDIRTQYVRQIALARGDRNLVGGELITDTIHSGTQNRVPAGSTAFVARHLVALLDDPETRRVIVDAQQAQRFADSGGMPPVSRLRLPFERLYIEFTEGIKIGEDEPGFDDVLLAMVIDGGDRATSRQLGFGSGDCADVKFLLRSTAPAPTPSGMVDYQWVDRGFFVDLVQARGITSIQNCLDDQWVHEDISTFPPEMEEYRRARDDGQVVFITVDGIEYKDRRAGFWERAVYDYTQFLAWLLTYMTAKGIVIVEEAKSRQVRRAEARMKQRPPAWHIVTVDPTVYSDAEEGGDGRGHSYRYDVRGHLRFGRHKRGDGSYSQTVEWVRPHQRGIKNAVYVPKTYLFDARSPRIDA